MIEIDGDNLTLEDVYSVSVLHEPVELSTKARNKVAEIHRKFLDLISSGQTIYGVNTGFGGLLNIKISREEEIELQRNLIRSHSAGVGKYLPTDVVRSIMVIRANTLAKGYSAVSTELIDALLAMINKDVVPAVPEFGSVGASGDLAPLAHIGLAMMGEGQAFLNGELMRSDIALSKVGLKPYEFKEKEGVALINGTSMMAGIMALVTSRAYRTIENAVRSSLLSFEALRGTSKAFSDWIVSARPHLGQIAIAEKMRKYLAGSKNVEKSDKEKVQDAYTLRCIPQVYGAVLDTLEYVSSVLVTEINSATDNPLFNGKEVVSGGNFHGEPIALAADFLSIALTDMGNMIERRIARLVDTNLSGLPPFLVKNSGLNSGYMIPQYTAAALCNRNKVLSYPSSADSIPTSANQEDHVSMGSTSTLKLLEIEENLEYIVAIEFLLGAQALEFSQDPISPVTKAIYTKIREYVKPLDKDRPSYLDIEKIREIMNKNELINAA
ncbi:histidine ammonia-lyase [Thermoplasma volcanium GSS1]|uniref:Probable histidine ammonia-lyase n=1 Tax=Thermoplasma volcanium (strain ATCC 51530 / DSM 4299 / JCM 9571 / NBRC 15438 / GSS1) TaxID=273116 RepID=HUTH_THEVO|nr:histidine ammonia-lyase [Thermoplasma volcanium]Q978N8.1 RecName: Full=Probable histidine ammonia-lyase; Short=Histidase [Thermoplasma volcanium GSS1]BAB60519.1 histidine ammonia-lyase [Thermoplasma volcanium GSS1]